MIELEVLIGMETEIITISEDQFRLIQDYGKGLTEEVIEIQTSDGQYINSSQIDDYKVLDEYAVIARDFYREHEPILFKVLAENKDEATNMAFKNDNLKEVLDVKLSNEIVWNEETKEKYWLLYADTKIVKN